MTMHPSRNLLHKSPKPFVGFGGFHTAPKGRDTLPHHHLAWEFVYYRSGFITCCHGRDSLPAKPGLLWLTPPGVVHAEIAHTAYRNIYFEVQAPADFPWPRTLLDDDRQNVGRLCAEIVLEQDNPQSASLRALLFQELLFRIEQITRQEKSTASSETVRRAEAIITGSLDAKPKLYDLARQTGVSVSGLRAAFHAVRGKSPLTVLREIRATHTMALLRNSTHSLESLAELCGYDSASHLSREIKRATGNPPGHLRTRA